MEKCKLGFSRTTSFQISSGGWLKAEVEVAVDVLVNQRRGVYVVGPPGTGKSVLVMESVKRLREMGKVTHLTASTNMQVDCREKVHPLEGVAVEQPVLFQPGMVRLLAQ